MEITTNMAAHKAKMDKVRAGFLLPRLNAKKFTATKNRNIKVLLIDPKEKSVRFSYSLVIYSPNPIASKRIKNR